MRQITDRIGGPIRALPVGVAVADVAARQHGVVSRRQLIAVGLTGRAIDRRIAAGWLHRIHPGVYSVGHPLLLPRARYMAAVLACGDLAVLSHSTAAAHLGMRGSPGGRVDVTVPRSGGRRRDGIAVHVTRSLPSSEVTTVEGIACTTPARTLVDLAAVVKHPVELRRALERSLELNLFDRTALDLVLDRAPNRRGTAVVRDVLADLPDEPPPISSELERRFLELIRAAALPYPVVNGDIRQLRVDFHWPAYGLVVETDGRATHDNAIAFERDRRRDLELQAGGWRVIRLSWRQVVNEPDRVAAVLRTWIRAE